MKRVLDLGCGLNKSPEAIGVDSNPDATAADLIADLNCPLPFPDSSFDSIRAVHIIEHVNDIMRAMAEIHRVARAGALRIEVRGHIEALFERGAPVHFLGLRIGLTFR